MLTALFEKLIENRIILTIFIIVALIFIIGPEDYFTHGFYCDVVPYENIAEEDLVSHIDLGIQNFECKFMPIKDHFSGFEIILANQPKKNTGLLLLNVYSDAGNLIDTVSVNLEKVTSLEWYGVHLNRTLKKNQLYKLEISAKNCATTPWLQIVDPGYLTNENISGNLLLGYAYAEPVFTFQNKVLLILLLTAFGGYVSSFVIHKKFSSVVRYISMIIFLTSILAWNYMYNSMDTKNTSFTKFSMGSETLVTGIIEAEQNKIWNKEKYGLGRYCDTSGELRSYELDFRTDNGWENGYSKEFSAISLSVNTYTKLVAKEGYYVEFANGSVFRIYKITKEKTYFNIYLMTDEHFTESKYGSLKKISFYDSDYELLPHGNLKAYTSQYGLQGKVFRHMARYMDHENIIANLNLLCSLLTAFVFVMIVILLWKKYNFLLAGSFFMTFWLSPWIVNFARNLYWVEFTWFLPMLIGLFCSWKINSKGFRIFCYAAVFIAVMGKCLCGYEYISVIMMGLIAFPLADLVLSVLQDKKENSKVLFRAVFLLGIAALAGFMAAICIHASLRGDGDIIEGIKNIFMQDVLRRTNGADLNEFEEKLWPSMNASVWEVYCCYFHFSTEIITGIQGNLFPLLCVTPLCIFVYEFKQQRLNIEYLSMYVIFFLTSVSWFCLAKSHSYIHTHLNYVLWYFGFVQICFYIILNKIQNVCFHTKL